MKKAFLVIVLLVGAAGCESALTEGILIGAGGSGVLSETEQLAEQKKSALIARIVQLQEQLATATDPAEVAILKDRLGTAEKQAEIAALTESITTQVQEGLQRDWSEPASKDNLAWILGSAGTILAGYGAKKTLDDRNKAKALTAVKIAAKPADERKIYEKIGTA